MLMSDDLWYPSADDVVDIHDDIVSGYDDTSAGVQSEGDIEFEVVDGRQDELVQHGLDRLSEESDDPND